MEDFSGSHTSKHRTEGQEGRGAQRDTQVTEETELTGLWDLTDMSVSKT